MKFGNIYFSEYKKKGNIKYKKEREILVVSRGNIRGFLLEEYID
jgi:hypothetical protein